MVLMGGVCVCWSEREMACVRNFFGSFLLSVLFATGC